MRGVFSLLMRFFYMFLRVENGRNYPPPLDPVEENECFNGMKNGDARAREKLIEHNLRLVAHIVKKYYPSAKNADDLISIGSIGLVKAVDTFLVKNGTKFATYAAKCIQNEILMYFRSQKKLCAEVSINETIDIDRDGNPLTYADILCSEENVTEEIGKKVQSDKILKLVDTILTKREKEIIVLRYGLHGVRPITQREIAEKLNISRSYVSRIEKSALCKLKDGLG